MTAKTAKYAFNESMQERLNSVSAIQNLARDNFEFAKEDESFANYFNYFFKEETEPIYHDWQDNEGNYHEETIPLTDDWDYLKQIFIDELNELNEA